MIEEYNVTSDSKYILLIKDVTFFCYLKGYNLQNILFYDELNSDVINKISKFVKIITTDKNDYKLLEHLNCLFLKISIKDSKNQIESNIFKLLHDNRSLIDVSNYSISNNSSNIVYIPTGFDTLDYALNDLQSSNLYIVTGRTGHGKSTFVEIVQNTAIEKGYKVLTIDGEHSRDYKIQNAYLKLLHGTDLLVSKKINKREIQSITALGESIIKEWIKGKFYLYTSCIQKNSREDLFKTIKNSIVIEGINLVIIDNIMSLNVHNGNDKYEAQKEFVDECQRLAKKYNVCVILVAHPRKDSREDISEYDISGTGDIPNLADVIITVSKSNDVDKGFDIDGKIKIKKNRVYSEFPTIDLKYFPQHKTLCEIKNGKIIRKKYNRLEKIIKKHKKEKDIDKQV